MFDKLYKDSTFQLQKDKFYSLVGLINRGFMTPTYFSKLVLLLILPAQNKTKAAHLESKTFMKDYFSGIYEAKGFDVNGLETIEVKLKNATPTKHVIFCCGNSLDAKDIVKYIPDRLNYSNVKYILWNYPGVQNSSAPLNYIDDLYNGCYIQVKRLLDSGVEPENITLYGHSLGGSVAVHTTKRLYKEDKAVNLVVDRSFSRISKVPSYIVFYLLEEYLNWSSVITSVVAFGIAGVAFGIALAGFISSISLILENLINAAGCFFALTIQLLGLIFNFVTFAIFNDLIDAIFNNASLLINNYFYELASDVGQALNFIGLAVGGIVALGGLLIGALMGGVIGAFLSISLLWTNHPLNMPMTSSFYFALNAACCEINSVSAMHNLINTKTFKEKNPKISVYNSLDDQVIHKEASLSYGIGPKEKKTKKSQNSQFFKDNVNLIWYDNVGHCELLSESNIVQ